jgi:hypothetical protein
MNRSHFDDKISSCLCIQASYKRSNKMKGRSLTQLIVNISPCAYHPTPGHGSSQMKVVLIVYFQIPLQQFEW